MSAEENMINEGLEFQQKGKYNEAIESFERARKLNPNYPKIREYLKKTRELQNKLPTPQQNPKNISYSQQESKKTPEQYNQEGLNFIKLGKYVEAIATFDEAIAIKSDYSDAWKNRGLAFNQLGKHKEAIASFEKSLTINQNDADAWCSRGILLQYLNQNSDARNSFLMALSINPKHERAQEYSGLKAAEYIAKAIQKMMGEHLSPKKLIK